MIQLLSGPLAEAEISGVEPSPSSHYPINAAPFQKPYAKKRRITALCFKATIDDLSRFKRSRSIGAYIGLTTPRHASGEVD